MDTKQLITGNPKEGFYPIVQDTVTVIELNEAVTNLTSESNSEEIAAAFDTVEGFNKLIENVRNSENIVNGILMNNDNAIGKIICTIYAYKNQYACDIEYIYNNKIIRLDVTNTDGTLSCIKNETNIGGDKTNVLILSLENDLANGQKDSPVNAEVSAALKDAISTGKACVIKSANSDILANLQQIGDNVTIIMEQISRVGQTFVAVNTTITVNTATNVISDYQTGAIVLETEGDGSKFLSNNGEYKEIPQPNLSNYLAKDNTTEYTPTGDYNPATKKYVDDNVSRTIANTNKGEFNLEYSLGDKSYSDTIFYDIYAVKTSNGYIAAMTLYTKGLAQIYNGTYISDLNDLMQNITFNIDVVYNYKDDDNKNLLLNSIIKGNIRINFNFNTIEYGLTSITTTCKQITLTESEYSALGNTSNDGVLYFVTPD